MSSLMHADHERTAELDARPIDPPVMGTKVQQLLGSSRRRMAIGGLALGLVLATSLILATAQPAWAIDYKAVSIATRTFSKPGLVEKTCLQRAEQGLAAGGFRVWDVADDGDRTVQGESAIAQVLATCVKDGQGTWGLVNAYADNVDDATRLAEALRDRMVGPASAQLRE